MAPILSAHIEAEQEHDHKIYQKRDGDLQHVPRLVHDFVTLKTEHHNNREKQGDKRDWANLGDEFLFIPCTSSSFNKDKPGHDSRQERDAEINENAFGNLADGDLDQRRLSFPKAAAAR